MPPAVQMVQLLGGFQLSQALHAAAKLGVADCLRGGPQDAESLATAVGADTQALRRVMRDLAIMWMETHYGPFGLLIDTVRTGRSAAAGAGRIVDVGGADGAVLAHVLAAAPGATGVVFDLPYLLSMILHDWSDAEPHLAKMIDLTMLGMLNGKERTQAEYRLLLEQAGFKFEGVTATPTPISIITALA